MTRKIQGIALLLITHALVSCGGGGGSSASSGSSAGSDPYARLPSPQLLSINESGLPFSGVRLTNTGARGGDALSPDERYVAFQLLGPGPETVVYRDRLSNKITPSEAPWKIPGVTRKSPIYPAIDYVTTIYSSDLARALTYSSIDPEISFPYSCTSTRTATDHVYTDPGKPAFSSRTYTASICRPVFNFWISGASQPLEFRAVYQDNNQNWQYTRFFPDTDPWTIQTTAIDIPSTHIPQPRALDRGTGCHIAFSNQTEGYLIKTYPDLWSTILYNVCTNTRVAEFLYLDNPYSPDNRYASFGAMSDDGRYLVLVATPNVIEYPSSDTVDTPDTASTWVVNMDTDTYTPVVTEEDGTPGAASISEDGQWIFLSTRKALVPEDTNGNYMDAYAIRNPAYTPPSP